MDSAFAHALLRRANDGEIGPTARIAQPAEPAIAFGRLDVRATGFPLAVARSRALGFGPVIRASGGRAAAYTRQTVLLDHVAPDDRPGEAMRRRFVEFSSMLAGVLTGLGVDARVGQVPGEFCPGEFSVNARGVAKVVGTAQRVVRSAWLFSAVIVVDGADELQALLSGVYASLGLAFESRSVGSLAQESHLAGTPRVTVQQVREALAAGYGALANAEPAELDQQTLARAHQLLDEHRVDPAVSTTGVDRPVDSRS